MITGMLNCCFTRKCGCYDEIDLTGQRLAGNQETG